MIRRCNRCNCELTGANCAKKDAKRFRKICRSCFKEKRNASRLIKNENETKHLYTLIEKNIVKIDFDPLMNDEIQIKKIDAKEQDNFLVKMFNKVKNIIREI